MKITKDCYVNVSGWTDEEVLRAAEMFAEVGGGVVGNINVRFPNEDYKYLMILEKNAFVGDANDLHAYGCVNELTKQDIFGDQQQQQQPSEYTGEGPPPVGTVCTAQHLEENLERRVKVIYYHEGYVWLKDLGGYEHIVQVACDIEFTPIKSEKDKEIEELDKDIDEWMDKEDFSLSHYLYNLGYRKTK